jgi:hypothetical protein
MWLEDPLSTVLSRCWSASRPSVSPFAPHAPCSQLECFVPLPYASLLPVAACYPSQCQMPPLEYNQRGPRRAPNAWLKGYEERLRHCLLWPAGGT